MQSIPAEPCIKDEQCYIHAAAGWCCTPPPLTLDNPQTSLFLPGASSLNLNDLKFIREHTFYVIHCELAHFCVSQEMLDIMKAIYDMMGKCTYPVLKEETPRQHVEVFFQACVWFVFIAWSQRY